MCLNPIFMRNPAKERYGGLPFIQVPCRKCKECLERMRDDYVTRTIALYNSLPPFYTPFFCTLTFRNEDLPRTKVWCRNNSSDWEIVDLNQPTFNHVIIRRFIKNFQEFCKKTFGLKVYVLISCEYGEKKHRPHYHAIIFFPSLCNWRKFKEYIERFWHYGFTKNISLVNIDGKITQRSVYNSIKYVCKYVNKHSSRWLPLYLKDSKFCTDYKPCDITPKIFVSNGYGKALLNVLTNRHFITGKIFMQLRYDKRDKGHEYFVPSYYRRLHFTQTNVISKELYFERLSDEPFHKNYKYTSVDKIPIEYLENHIIDPTLKYIRKYKIKTLTNRVNGYDKVLFDNFVKTLRVNLFDFNQLVKTDKRFVRYLLNVFDNTLISPDIVENMSKIYLETHVPDSLSPLSLSVSRENSIRTHYIIPFVYTQIERVRYFREICSQARKHGLPWLPLRSVSFAVSRPTAFSTYPTDYYKLLFAQQYKRAVRYNQNLITEDVEREYLQTHILSYNDIE